MQNILKTFLAGFMIFALWSCKKDENRVILKDGTPPVLTSSTTGDVPLSKSTETQPAIKFSWTNPEYQFNTGVNSQDISYTLQFDTTGADSSSPDMQEVSFSKDLNTSFSVKDLNAIMAKIGLLENISHDMEVRVISSFASGVAPLTSNVVKFTATPYLDVVVPLPVTDSLFLIGSITDPNWTNPVPVPVQAFTKTSSTTYEITIPMIGGQEFLIIPQNGSWSNKYAITRGNSPDVGALRQGGSFGYNLGDNFYGPALAGTYKVVLNFKTGKYIITQQ